MINPNGTITRSFGSKGSEYSKFMEPSGIGINSLGQIIVAGRNREYNSCNIFALL